MGNLLYTDLKNRALLRVTGDDAKPFLHGLITCDIEFLKVGEMKFGALLSPQGKILFDFFVVRANEGYIIDIDKSILRDFVTRLTFYRLRAKVIIEPIDPATHVFAIWRPDGAQIENLVIDGLYDNDPRHKQLSVRAYLKSAPQDGELSTESEYERRRTSFGMPLGGLDYAFGNAFPHEALMDQFEGIDFKKGCYIGQEVVSRMQHRGTARKRIIRILADEALPDIGSEITIDGRSVGQITSVSNEIGLAMVRLDKAGDAVRANSPINAGTVPIRLEIPDWVNFSWPAA